MSATKMTKSQLIAELAAMREAYQHLRASLPTQAPIPKVTRVVETTTQRPVLFQSLDKSYAWRLRNHWAKCAAKRGLDRKFALQPRNVERNGRVETTYVIF